MLMEEQTNRYEQLTLRANSLREELHTEVERILNDVIKFKVHVQKSLEDYEGFVVDEVELELAPPPPSGGAGTSTSSAKVDDLVEAVQGASIS